MIINSQQYIIATIHSWNIENYQKYFGKNSNFSLITSPKELTLSKISQLNPTYIFFPHWSWIIPKEIWSKYTCIVFHLTDLPYGRGGTPLQNLIERGHKNTKISAFKVEAGIDCGDIYFKVPLSLSGSAEEIFNRLSDTTFSKMIPRLLKHPMKPKKQTGKAVYFKRRNHADSKIRNSLPFTKLYDFVRMLDAPEYPKAFLESNTARFEFSKIKKKKNVYSAEVMIYEKK
jgi:methionyl-tRNA formyltransferase